MTESVIRLEEWYVVRIPNNGNVSLHLGGKVFGHPRFEDGREITTSSIISYDEESGIVGSKNTRYQLGEVDKDFAKQCPNAKQQLLEATRKSN